MVNGGRAGYMGMGVRRPNIWPYIIDLLGPFRKISEHARETSGKYCPTCIAINQLAVRITRRSLSFGCICINSSTCFTVKHNKARTVNTIISMHSGCYICYICVMLHGVTDMERISDVQLRIYASVKLVIIATHGATSYVSINYHYYCNTRKYNNEYEKVMIKADISHADSHYADVIMTKMASQITSLTVVYSTVYSDADQIKHQSSASLAFVWGIHRDRWIPRTKGQLRGKCFHLVTSSCI